MTQPDPLSVPDQHLDPVVAANYDAAVADRSSGRGPADGPAGRVGGDGAREFAVGSALRCHSPTTRAWGRHLKPMLDKRLEEATG
jgi:hypothetical protein